MEKITRIALSGSSNTRDLGGLPTKDGYTIRPHRLIRSCNLSSLTEEDKHILSGTYDLKTIVDFRTRREAAEKPDPAIDGALYHHIPVLEDVTAGITHEETSGEASFEHTIGLLIKKGISPADYMKNMYRDIAKNPHAHAAYRNFFEILLSQESGASLWHCSAGKDRAGIGSALVLYALGVDWDLIISDYLMTSTFLAEDIDAILKKLSASTDNPQLIECIHTCLDVRQEYIESVFCAYEEAFTSTEQFLREALGLSDEKKDQLKSLYLM